MRRPFPFLLIVLAMLTGSIAMQSGVASAAMPDRQVTSQAGHCGDAPVDKDHQSDAMTEYCAAMCAALAPLGGLPTEPGSRRVLALSGNRPVEYRPILTELPTPPPRI